MASTAPTMKPTAVAQDVLAGWDDDRLVALFEARPDLAHPPPRSLASLAARAVGVDSAYAALSQLDGSASQVIEALSLLAPTATVERLAAILAPNVGPADLDRPLARLERLALVFREDGALTLNPGVEALARRTGIGPPITGLLATVSASDLGAMCRRLGVRPGSPKAVSVAAIAAAVSDPARARHLVEVGPPGTAALAEQAAQGAHVRTSGGPYGLDDRTPAGWLARRGLLATIDWYHLVMPAEVSLALRGGVVFPAFTGDAPEVPTQPIDPDTVDTAGAEQALRAVADLTDVFEAWAAQTPKRLKDGGIGVRDLRRTAKAIDRSERDTARLLDVAVAAGLVWFDPTMDAALPTARFDEWCLLEPVRRWATLVAAWQSAEFHPSLAGAISTKDKPIPPLLVRGYEADPVACRRAMLEAMASVPEGAAAPTSDALLPRAHWSRPQLWRTGPASPTLLATWVIEECDLLGITANGALTTAGRRLATGDITGAEAAQAERAPACVDDFVVQADLTAVAAGALRPQVARELELLADVESRGAATVYRFSPASLRRAFDAGRAADEIAAFLDRHAPRGVPQALSYLVADVGRRHGVVRAGAARAYVRSDDVALLAELRQARAAAKLRLRALAPTVLVTDAAPAAVLTTLRAAGYLPAEEDGTGAVVLSRPASHRAPEKKPLRPIGRLPASRAPAEVDAAAAVAQLRTTAAAEPGPQPLASPLPLVQWDESPERPTEIVRDPTGILDLLEWAWDEEWPLRLSYTNSQGMESQMVVVVLNVTPRKVVVETPEGHGTQTLNLYRIQWARVLTEAEEDQLP